MTRGKAFPPTRLVLVRHGEVEERFQRVFAGRLDIDLSARGHEQAAALAECLNAYRLAALYVSPLKRARLTARPIARRTGLAAVTLAELRETDFGAWTGLSWEAVTERFQVQAGEWLTQLEQGAIPGAESGARLRTRIGACLRRILAECPGRAVAVVCHGGVIRVMLSLLLDLPLPKLGGFEIDYASVTVVACQPGKAEVRLLNHTPWNGLP